MPITEDRMLKVLAALEDYEAALHEAESLVAQAQRNASEFGGDPKAALENLSLMLKQDFLLRSPVTTRLTLEREREHWTSSRLAANAKRRGKKKPNEGEKE